METVLPNRQLSFYLGINTSLKNADMAKIEPLLDIRFINVFPQKWVSNNS